MTDSPTDVIDRMLGTRPGGRLDRIRNARPEARRNAQLSYEALLEPPGPVEMSLLERRAVAAFVTGLHRVLPVADFYAARLAAADPRTAHAVAEEVVRGLTAGPYGAYREPALAAESTPGPTYAVGHNRAELGTRLTAALEHAHLLVLHPRSATPQALTRLVEAGWSTDGIVALAQLVSFLTFQVRVVAGLGHLERAEP